ncbi:hypothetical protein PG993_009054 [Apiospora rasikravindrae]|uniref:Uncharacterized protein n=1 Tax=Apiospora rasikravindrae TaxID=990691 RepID=A0ABR1SIE2_9PEZI
MALSNPGELFAQRDLEILPGYVRVYDGFTDRGVCTCRQATQQPPHVQGRNPFRIGSLRDDYLHAPPGDVNPAEALMDDNNNNPNEPRWLPTIDVCMHDLKYHFEIYRAIPPLRGDALQNFKQCLISFVPAWTGLPVDPQEVAFAELVRDIYAHSKEGDRIRTVVVQFGVWVEERCGPQRRWPRDRLSLFACVQAAQRGCWRFCRDVADGCELLGWERRSRSMRRWAVGEREREREQEGRAREGRRRETRSRARRGRERARMRMRMVGL